MKDLITAMRVLAEELDKSIDRYNDEHNGLYVVHSAILSAADRLEAELPKDGGWIKWDGGVMPVEDETQIDIRMRRQGEMLGVTAGFGFASPPYWENHDSSYDIIAYRVLP